MILQNWPELLSAIVSTLTDLDCIWREWPSLKSSGKHPICPNGSHYCLTGAILTTCRVTFTVAGMNTISEASLTTVSIKNLKWQVASDNSPRAEEAPELSIGG